MDDEKPCYFCGKADKIRSTIKIGEILMKTVICKTCTHVALDLMRRLPIFEIKIQYAGLYEISQA